MSVCYYSSLIRDKANIYISTVYSISFSDDGRDSGADLALGK